MARYADVVADRSPQTVVYVTIIPDRLTFAYQFFREASQSNQHFRRTHEKVTTVLAVRTVCTVTLRFLLGAALIVVPVFGVASPVIATRSLGWSVGRIKALLGDRSTLYC
jgi:succinoglycan biosynthesis protein ExoM